MSRYHANIRIHQGKLFLEDNDSKFGSLVMLRRPLVMRGNANITVLVGRTLLQFETKKAASCWAGFLCMCRAENAAATRGRRLMEPNDGKKTSPCKGADEVLVIDRPLYQMIVRRF